MLLHEGFPDPTFRRERVINFEFWGPDRDRHVKQEHQAHLNLFTAPNFKETAE